MTLLVEYEEEVHHSPPKRVELAMTEDLAGVFADAATVNSGDVTPLSFSSLLVGFLTVHTTLAEELLRQLATFGVTVARIASRRQMAHQVTAAMPLPSEVAVSRSAYAAIKEGESIMVAVGAGTVLDAKHLAAAYPVLKNWHLEDFQELGIDRLAWARMMGAYCARAFPNERKYWRTYADRAAPVPLTSFSADVYTQKDLLGIDRCVDALALLIASVQTDTPLAIGMFGPWGSGKSFYMRHLRSRIWDLAKREKNKVAAWTALRNSKEARAEDAPPYYGQVAQVEFNAWHYNEGSLVASLVDHLFRNLRVFPGKDDQLEARRLDAIGKVTKAERETTRTTVEVEETQKQVKEAEVEVEKTTNEVIGAQRELDSKTRDLEETTADAERERKAFEKVLSDQKGAAGTANIDDVLALVASPIVESKAVTEAKQAVDTTLGAAADWRKFLERLFSVRGLVVLAVCVAGPVVAVLADWLNEAWATALGAGAAGIASFSSVLKFVKEHRDQFEEKWQKLGAEEEARNQALQRALQQKWEAKRSALLNELEGRRATLSALEEAASKVARELAARSKELDSKLSARVEAEAKLSEARAALDRFSSALMLDEFLKERSGTDDYRKQLGLLALVRRDFERLSDLIVEANEEWRNPSENKQPPLLNRIVLYIDDLDRCSEKTVLAVLEVVHLLLAFPLFVCVVAVDPRWIEKCLREKHEKLFVDAGKAGDPTAPNDAGTDPDAGVTVGDYLEKIFQIPIWMSPIGADQRAAVVRSLLGATAAPQAGGARQLPGESGAREGTPHRAYGDVSSEDAFQALVEKKGEAPDPLRITPEEAEFVGSLGPLLSDKPRALKRFVNMYRLLKASLPDIDQQSFVSQEVTSAHRICMSQLALVTGRPRLAPTLFGLLERLPPSEPGTLQDWKGRLPAEHSGLGPIIDLIPDSGSIPVTTFRQWLPDTSRYLFHRVT